jgi:hypothetical protein
MEERLWTKLHTAINRAESAVPSSQQSSGSSGVDEDESEDFSYPLFALH